MSIWAGLEHEYDSEFPGYQSFEKLSACHQGLAEQEISDKNPQYVAEVYAQDDKPRRSMEAFKPWAAASMGTYPASSSPSRRYGNSVARVGHLLRRFESDHAAEKQSIWASAAAKNHCGLGRMIDGVFLEEASNERTLPNQSVTIHQRDTALNDLQNHFEMGGACDLW